MQPKRLHLVLLGLFMLYAVGMPRFIHLMSGECANCCASGLHSCRLGPGETDGAASSLPNERGREECGASVSPSCGESCRHPSASSGSSTNEDDSPAGRADHAVPASWSTRLAATPEAVPGADVGAHPGTSLELVRRHGGPGRTDAHLRGATEREPCCHHHTRHDQGEPGIAQRGPGTPGADQPRADQRKIVIRGDVPGHASHHHGGTRESHDDERCGLCDMLAKSLVLVPALPEAQSVLRMREVASAVVPASPICPRHYPNAPPRAPPGA